MYTILPTVTTLAFAALFRILWLEFIFRRMTEPTLEVLMYSYPISWALCAGVNYLVLYLKLKRFSGPDKKFITVR